MPCILKDHYTDFLNSYLIFNSFGSVLPIESQVLISPQPPPPLSGALQTTVSVDIYRD